MNNKYTFLYGSKIYTKANDTVYQKSTSIGISPDAVETTPITILAIISGVLPSQGPIEGYYVESYYEGSQVSVTPVPFSRAVLFYDQMGKALSDPNSCPTEGCAPCTLTYAPCGPSGVIVSLSENPATSGGEVRYFGALAPTVSVSPSIDQSWAVLSNWSKDIDGVIPASQLPGLYDTAVILRTVSVAPSTSPMIKHLIATNEAVVDLNIRMLGNALFLCNSSWGVQPNSTPYPSSSMKLLEILDTYPPNGNVTFRDSSGYYGNITPLSTTTIVCDTNRIGAKCNPLSSALPFVNASPTPSGRNSANYATDIGRPSNVGTNGGASFYGTYDQTGNVKEWTDNASIDTYRTIRGGSFDENSELLIGSSYRSSVLTSSYSSNRGFRLASSSAGPLVQTNDVFSPAFVVVGDTGNASDSGYGSVAASYYIQKNPVTVREYCAFLNSISETHQVPEWLRKLNDRLIRESVLVIASYLDYDWREHYTPSIEPLLVRLTQKDNYLYVPNWSRGSYAMTSVNWFDCARYANWKNNGSQAAPTQDQGGMIAGATTESGAYTLTTQQTTGSANIKTAGSSFWIPTEDEWYKAAYYKGGSSNAGYWDYATQSNEPPYPISAINKDGTALTLPSSGYMIVTMDPTYDNNYHDNSCVPLDAAYLFDQPIVRFTKTGPETYVFSLQAGYGDHSNDKFNLSSYGTMGDLFFNADVILTAGDLFSVRVKAIGNGGTILYKVLTFSACSS